MAPREATRLPDQAEPALSWDPAERAGPAAPHRVAPNRAAPARLRRAPAREVAAHPVAAGTGRPAPDRAGEAPRGTAAAAAHTASAADIAADVQAAIEQTEPLHPTANRPYTVANRRYYPMSTRKPFRQRGMASWYGKAFHGRRTAMGERFDMTDMTAAHPTLPLPSWVRVTNARTGTSVVVRVNDRGPFAGNRIIDLSHAAADRLGFIDDGLVAVEVELLLPDDSVQTESAD